VLGGAVFTVVALASAGLPRLARGVA
jgi:hypothetical protein